MATQMRRSFTDEFKRAYRRAASMSGRVTTRKSTAHHPSVKSSDASPNSWNSSYRSLKMPQISSTTYGTCRVMIVVVYNNRAAKDDGFIQGAKKARNGIGAGSVRGMAEELGKLPDHCILTLIIADHGASGLQGLGSGQTADTSVGTNLSSEYIKASQIDVNSGLTGGAAGMVGAQGTGPEPMIGYLLKLTKNSFTSRNQVDSIDVIRKKLKVGGYLFLAGCSVGEGDEGKKLLQSLGLSLQNHIRVVASRHPTSWTDTTKAIIYPAKWNDRGANPRLVPSDMIGYMGMRELSSDEIQTVLDKTDIMSTGQ